MHCLHHFLEAVGRGEPGNPNLTVGVQLQRTLARIATMSGGV
jgi:hypothetical protein